MSEFGGKVVLVTGAGRGLGREIARAFAVEGARVAANDITPINLDETLAIIAEEGGEARGFLGDISRRMEVKALASQVTESLGPIQILVNNAGVAPRVDLLSMDEWDWDRTLAVNLKGPFLLTQTIGRQMVDKASGVIINVASPQAKDGTLAQAGAYLASKAGLLALTRQAALELAPHGIRVNAVCPSLPSFTARSGSTGSGQERRADQELEDAIRAAIARTILYLSSDQSTFITGESIVIDPARGLSAYFDSSLVEERS